MLLKISESRIKIMAALVLDLEYPDPSGRFISPPLEVTVGLGQEVQSGPQITFVETLSWFSAMTKVPENISDVIWKRLEEIAHVDAVLMGRSGDVYHVWVMTNEWNPASRKSVYAAQKELLIKLKGFDIDFYLVPLDKGARPEDLVSGIPIVFKRAA
jgi:hypothetical protein